MSQKEEIEKEFKKALRRFEPEQVPNLYYFVFWYNKLNEIHNKDVRENWLKKPESIVRIFYRKIGENGENDREETK